MIDSQQSSKILIVDDNQKNIQVLGEILRDHGYQISVAQNGEQAIKAANMIMPDVILLDVMMPVMDGYETCTALKQAAATKNIPVMFLTAKSESSDIVKAFELGACDYITKPFKAAELLARVNTQIELRLAREKLLESELMHSLKTLVIGIAHEINTPLGVAITANDYMASLVENIKQLQSSEEAISSSSECSECCANIKESSQIISRNLEKISEMIKHFKQISVDVSTNKIKLFNIKEYIDYILYDIHPLINKKKLQFQLEYDDQNIKSYPEDFIFIISNLLNNAITHAFQNQQDGHLLLKVNVVDGRLSIVVEDDGIGIDKEKNKHIFEPFYTTRRGQFMGLGLSVIYNLVYQKLKGQMSLESNLGSGSRFVIEYPVAVLKHQKTYV